MAPVRRKIIRSLPAKLGRPLSGRAPLKENLLRLYVREGKSIREVAEVLGVSKDSVYRTLKRYGIEARTNVKRSGLREYPLEKLEIGVKKKGIRGLARELGIHENTLRNYLRKA
jgi:transposase-like protein